jgi:hyperosmotically inducible protein
LNLTVFRNFAERSKQFMRERKLKTLQIVLWAVAFSLAVAVSAAAAPQATNAHITREVRHELVMLPYYGVFDWLQFEVRPDNTVVLRGQVVRPSTKSDAEARVREIEGVKQVINELQVLSPSPADDRLRRALYRSLYGQNSPLFRYATQSVPSIHIIVDRGRAVLKGVVGSRGDAVIANARARSVPGLFSVKSELSVEGESAR